ncbi:L-type lectin-domain containing receptor kinase SIT2-like [Phragmites australis]|uniref:L-type lectin-domain containing receptor kinase SIT2-like n=1 Tax=Phragmites australis TaxID=29695 RepID=UPI002D7A2476|nr:L-type lectin-domain containing receptor kinase SIT2-like [Phragmites australis]
MSYLNLCLVEASDILQMKHMSLFLCFIISLVLTFSDFAVSESQFVYHGFSGAHLTLDGNAMVTPDGLLELTNDTVNLGHAFYPTPLNFHQQLNGTVQSFSVSFVFAILSVHANISTMGMAFFVSPTKNLSNTGLQYIGLLNSGNDGNTSNHMFVVELDTTQNVEFKDIDNNHVGININSLHSLKAHHTGYYDDMSSSFKNLTLTSGKAMQVWADYDGETSLVNVSLAPVGEAKPVAPLLSSLYNLSAILRDPSYIGFSATTGAVRTRHCVLGWSFAMNGPAPAIDISKLPKLPRIGPKPHSKVLEITLPIASAVFVSTLGFVIVLLVYRRLRYTEVKEDWEVDFGPHRFSFKDLFHATGGFKRKNLLGEGGFGKVYKGVLPKSNVEIAVKRVSPESRQGMKEFIAEVVSVGRLRHRNLVPLLGYCRRQGELLLVYDYMPNGSLNKYLYSEDGRLSLSWAQRFNIIKGVAFGLFYLHEKWEKVVIHRDIKPSNVLLDREMNGRLGDFGLSRLYDHGTDPQTTHMVGTMGYLAPEMVRTGKASTLTDVFAFGVFLLELTSAQRPVKQNEQGNQDTLIDWVLEHWHNGLLMETVDPRLQDDYNAEEACLVLKLGLLCSHPFISSRPTMRQVMQYLEGDTPLPDLTATHFRFTMQALTRNNGFESPNMSYPDLATSIGTFSSLSGGR